MQQLRIMWGLSAMLALSNTAAGQVCIGTEPPATGCDVARVIPGTQGHHIVMVDVSTATGTSTICNGIFTGNNVWFDVTPDVSGPMTITTCHPVTQYDTVLQVYSGGDSNCDFMTTETCNDDDSFGLGCTSGCGPRSSTVLVQASAGTRYRFVVGSFGGSITSPCQPCLGVRVTIGAPCGDPPNNFDSSLATEILGEPGVYTGQVDVTDAIKLPSEPNPTCVGPDVGHTVWYSVTPQQSGRLTVSTCTPTTNFDTVAAIYQDAGGGVLLGLDCSDDDPNATCINPCDGNPIGSRASAPVTAGIPYLIQIGSYNDNGFPHTCATPLCLGVRVTLASVCETDLTPPEVALQTPPELNAGCTCHGAAINGWAYDPNGTFDNWTLEYRPIGSSSWTLIAGGGEVLAPGGTLANWGVGVPQGYYVVRLTGTNVCGRAASVERVVWLDDVFDSLSAATTGGTVLGGGACIGGTAQDSFCFSQYTVDYRPVGSGAFLPVDPGNPVYTTPLINTTLATWDTTTLPDGGYELRVDGETDCGDGAALTFPVTVDNTPPTVLISSPGNCDMLTGVVQIVGTATDANLSAWSLSYTGGGVNGWVQLSSGVSPVVNGVLANWDVSGLPPCSYTLRLLASDAAALNCNGAIHHTSEYLVSVDVPDPLACPEDINGDGMINISDLGFLLQAFGGMCP